MNYKDYQNARDLVWRILIEDRIRSLPIGVVPICRHRGIAVKMYDGNGEDGYTQIIGGVPTIFISSAVESRGRQRFTAAHELGHILLGHVGRYRLVNREPSSDDNPIEQAANVFASRLLAPACVLWGCGASSAKEIMQLCDISRQAAQFRAQRMEELTVRGKFLTSPLEQEVYAQFLPYIQEYKL